MAFQTYEKMSKAKKAEATHNNAGTSARESGADAAKYVKNFVLRSRIFVNTFNLARNDN